MIPASVERVNGGHLLRGGVPYVMIHARCLLAMVFRHSSHRQDLGAVRVSEQVLQGFDPAPPARLCRLHDTRLESTHDAMGFVPVNLVPVRLSAGGRTNVRACVRDLSLGRHHLLASCVD